MLTPVIAGSVRAPSRAGFPTEYLPAYLTTTALVISAASLLWFSTLTAESGVGDVALRMAVGGVGMGVFSGGERDIDNGRNAA